MSRAMAAADISAQEERSCTCWQASFFIRFAPLCHYPFVGAAHSQGKFLPTLSFLSHMPVTSGNTLTAHLGVCCAVS